jgi:hypothetical protein
MSKPGRGAPYPGSSEQGTPRGVERTTWLSRGFTGAIGTPFCHLKIRSADGLYTIYRPPNGHCPQKAGLCMGHLLQKYVYMWATSQFCIYGPPGCEARPIGAACHGGGVNIRAAAWKGAGLAPGPQALPMSAAALVLYINRKSEAGRWRPQQR